MLRVICRQCFICLLLFFLTTGQAAAFDLQVGHLNFGPAPAGSAGDCQANRSGFGAMVTLPLGFSESKPPNATLNGQDLSHFTRQNAQDSLIVIMLVGVAIAAGTLTVSIASD